MNTIEDRARQRVKDPQVLDGDRSRCSRLETHRFRASVHSSSQTKRPPSGISEARDGDTDTFVSQRTHAVTGGKNGQQNCRWHLLECSRRKLVASAEQGKGCALRLEGGTGNEMTVSTGTR